MQWNFWALQISRWLFWQSLHRQKIPDLSLKKSLVLGIQADRKWFYRGALKINKTLNRLHVFTIHWNFWPLLISLWTFRNGSFRHKIPDLSLKKSVALGIQAHRKRFCGGALKITQTLNRLCFYNALEFLSISDLSMVISAEFALPQNPWPVPQEECGTRYPGPPQAMLWRRFENHSNTQQIVFLQCIGISEHCRLLDGYFGRVRATTQSLSLPSRRVWY